MKKFFLLGTWTNNTGPANVNRALIENSDKWMSYLRFHSFWTRLERLRLILYPVIVVSGGALNYEIKLAKILHKKLIYIMHGCVWYESEINNLQLKPSMINNESYILNSADLILCVSEKYSEWVKTKYPHYKEKISFLNNGLKLNVRPKLNKESLSIALSGGNRRQKNNLQVCRAIEKLRQNGLNCTVYLFGRTYENNEDLTPFSFVRTMGHMNKEEYYSALDKISLFVINSTIESFGLVVGDALNCNCSLLMSTGVGATSIMQTQDFDVINNCEDVEEIARKVEYLLMNPNFERLYLSIDKEQISEKQAYLNLKHIIDEI